VAARRVLVDLGQVLASFQDCVVVIGGWVPDLQLKDAKPLHVGSIDVDLALDVAALGDGRYAKLIESLLGTGRYKQSAEPAEKFRLHAPIDLKEAPTRSKSTSTS
jgi:hypothetical protein